MQFKLIPSPTPSLTVLGVTSQTSFTYLAHVKDLNFAGGGRGENLVKVVFMSMYRRLAANFIQNDVKKRRCPKPFGRDCSLNSPRQKNSVIKLYKNIGAFQRAKTRSIRCSEPIINWTEPP